MRQKVHLLSYFTSETSEKIHKSTFQVSIQNIIIVIHVECKRKQEIQLEFFYIVKKKYEIVSFTAKQSVGRHIGRQLQTICTAKLDKISEKCLAGSKHNELELQKTVKIQESENIIFPKKCIPYFALFFFPFLKWIVDRRDFTLKK